MFLFWIVSRIKKYYVNLMGMNNHRIDMSTDHSIILVGNSNQLLRGIHCVIAFARCCRLINEQTLVYYSVIAAIGWWRDNRPASTKLIGRLLKFLPETHHPPVPLPK